MVSLSLMRVSAGTILRRCSPTSLMACEKGARCYLIRQMEPMTMRMVSTARIDKVQALF